jgi:hypothetical protein
MNIGETNRKEKYDSALGHAEIPTGEIRFRGGHSDLLKERCGMMAQTGLSACVGSVEECKKTV